ncbi:TPM domain-containing protein [Flavobacterium paronense]|uniref:TPM domain-containing protein n=1 Tax=Flavobacterium paronense TaxID=1392775 RepID=A0ABV5GCK9_9FLAO|nr:TPM domain-containing protein [Flavobacterium paronense]MDN3676315.1 TPM domain-containing protein [Flavobacterium paronense]
MSKVEDFLTKAEEQEIVEAIGKAEKNTSGEIRVHIEKETSIAAIDRAMEVFRNLSMENTQERNGVIIYVAVKSKQFAIYGDKGINEKVGVDFWDATKEIMQNQFKNGNFKQGLIDGILKAGEQLKTYFPYADDDINELSNEISLGE